jgi:hypothetical protein
VTAVDGDPAGPVLGVDHKHSAGTDEHVVDVRETPSRPSDVMQSPPAWRQGREYGGCGSLTLSALLEQIGSFVEPICLLACSACNLAR